MRGLPWALIVLGIALRLRGYFSGRSLWTDEATLALNIATRSFAGLAQPLDYHQTAPLGYLWAARAATGLFGVSEPSLRLVALLAGCGLLFVILGLGRRLAGRRAGLAVLALTALSPALVYYSAEAKPYASDALVTALLLWAATAALGRKPDARSTAALALAGAAAVWCSAPAILVLSALGAVLVATGLRSRSRPRLVQAAVAGAAWVTSFAGAWLVVYRQASESAYMRDYWDGAFLSLASARALARSLKESSEVVWSLFVAAPSSALRPRVELALLAALALAVAGLAVAGFERIRRTHRSAAAWIVAAPVLVAAAASLADLYPVATRLVLFLVPPLLLLVGAGMVSAARLLAPRSPEAGVVVLAAAFGVVGLDPGGQRSVSSVRWTEAREVIEAIRSDTSAAPVYVYARGVPVYEFYSTDWRSPDRARIGPGRRELIGRPTGMRWRYGVGVAGQRPAPGWAEQEARRIREAAAPDAWVLFIHDVDQSQLHLLPEIERQGGVRRETIERRRALLYRYQFPEGGTSWHTSIPAPGR